MNQREATQRFADELKRGYVGQHVNIGRPIEGDHPDMLIVVFEDGLILSVTAEILAQP